jgi:hypothetical protein
MHAQVLALKALHLHASWKTVHAVFSQMRTLLDGIMFQEGYVAELTC